MLKRAFSELRHDVPIYLAFTVVSLAQLGTSAYLEHLTLTTDIGLGAAFIALPLMVAMFASLQLAAFFLLLSSFSVRKRLLWWLVAMSVTIAVDRLNHQGLIVWYFRDGQSWLGFGVLVVVAAICRVAGYTVDRSLRPTSVALTHITIVDLLWWMAVAAFGAFAWTERYGNELPGYALCYQSALQAMVLVWCGLRRTGWLAATIDILCTSLVLSLAWSWLTVGSEFLTTIQVLSGWLMQVILLLGIRSAGYRIIPRSIFDVEDGKSLEVPKRWPTKARSPESQLPVNRPSGTGDFVKMF